MSARAKAQTTPERKDDGKDDEWEIGGVTFHRAPKSWAVSRQLRDIFKTREKAQRRSREKLLSADRIQRKALEEDRDLTEAENEQIDQLNDEAWDAGDESDLQSYQILIVMLRDKDGKAPTLEFLQEHADLDRDVSPLQVKLSGGREPDPSPETTDTQTSSSS